VLTKLSPPIYPPLARQARINGEVDLKLGIRPDGTVGSVCVISGHPMLSQVAMESAQQSQFDCSACASGLNSYSVRYKFELLPLDHTKDCATLTDEERNGSPPPRVDLSQHEITVFGKVMETCDPAAELRKVRSARCLYLWRCANCEVTP
jgi:TonB family protein